MDLRKQLVKLGVEQYIALPREARSRRQLNALIYYHLLRNWPHETEVRMVCLNDGGVNPWIDGIRRDLVPFLERFGKCLENT